MATDLGSPLGHERAQRKQSLRSYAGPSEPQQGQNPSTCPWEAGNRQDALDKRAGPKPVMCLLLSLCDNMGVSFFLPSRSLQAGARPRS